MVFSFFKIKARKEVSQQSKTSNVLVLFDSSEFWRCYWMHCVIAEGIFVFSVSNAAV